MVSKHIYFFSGSANENISKKEKAQNQASYLCMLPKNNMHTV